MVKSQTPAAEANSIQWQRLFQFIENTVVVNIEPNPMQKQTHNHNWNWEQANEFHEIFGFLLTSKTLLALACLYICMFYKYNRILPGEYQGKKASATESCTRMVMFTSFGWELSPHKHKSAGPAEKCNEKGERKSSALHMPRRQHLKWIYFLSFLARSISIMYFSMSPFDHFPARL